MTPPTASQRPPDAARPTFRTPLPELRRGAAVPAKRYTTLSSEQCRAEVQRRQLPIAPASGKTSGMDAPFVIKGPLRDVTFELPRSIYGFIDCRLVLLLDDMAGELAAFGVVAVQVNNTYRPSAVRPPDTTAAPAKPQKRPAPKKSSRAKGGAAKKTRKPARPPEPIRLSQHALGLAIDITGFRLRDGRTLDIERDWFGALGTPPCGPFSEVRGDEPAGILLRDLTCALARAGYCNHLITPNRDQAHYNHLHCDIEAGAPEVTVE